MIPPYIINGEDQSNQPAQIQLEIDDYSLQYYEWLKKKELEKTDKEIETVIIIDI